MVALLATTAPDVLAEKARKPWSHHADSPGGNAGEDVAALGQNSQTRKALEDSLLFWVAHAQVT